MDIFYDLFSVFTDAEKVGLVIVCGIIVFVVIISAILSIYERLLQDYNIRFCEELFKDDEDE